ncbi:MAG TPA: permease [Thermoanaerobacterales bacterium]|nr:permease [Thermoanaerobacterales bacterium]
MKTWQKFAIIVGVFLAAFYMPLSSPRFTGAVLESLYMLQEYARLHVLTCLVPALFIAGAISNFISQEAVIKYFGSGAKKWVSYAVASVSGTILAVCSCTVLPLFAGIYRRGAGLGPAVAFLYSGPAINVLAIIMTARILGWQLGVARAVGAVSFSVIIGLIMEMLFRKEDSERLKSTASKKGVNADEGRSLAQNLIYFATLVFILIFAAWGKPAQPVGLFSTIYVIKWYITVLLLGLLAFILINWFKKDELSSWLDSTWGFAQQILPLLFAGVLAAGFLMGRPGTDAGIIPSKYVAAVVGGNSLLSNFIASVVGAFMYFATLTEVPILQGLLGSGMGQGPALALLLSGPALSLPSMLVINSVLGLKKTAAYVALVIVMSTITGYIYGLL